MPDFKTSSPEKKLTPETLQQFCDRWQVPLSWGYRHTRLNGKDRLPHFKCGKYIRIDPAEADDWMMGGRK